MSARVILRSGQHLDVAEAAAVVEQLLLAADGDWLRLRTSGGALLVRLDRIDAVLPA